MAEEEEQYTEQSGGRRPRAGKKTLLRMASYLGADIRLLVVVGVLVLVGIASNLMGSYMLRPLINRYILPGDLPGLAGG